MGGITKNSGFTGAVRAVVAGTAADAPTAADTLIQVSTDGAQVCTVTLPEAASNLGLILAVQFETDGGVNTNVAVTGADTIDIEADIGNTSYAMADAGDFIVVMAVSDNQWAILSYQGGVLA